MSEQPLQTNGFNTSIDLVRRQPFSIPPPLAGHKRPPEHSSGDLPSKSSSTGLNPSLHQVVSSPEARPVDLARPSVNAPRGRLIASEIRPVTAAGDDDHHQYQNAEEPNGAPPGSSQNPLLSLKYHRYGLPPALIANFAALGVTSIYAWQASCLLANGLLSGERHLVYTAPTGGGKSLVADVLMLKRIIENPSHKAILVLPYVALVQEKLKWLRRIAQDVEKYVPEDQDAASDAQPAYKRWKKQQKSIRVTGYYGGNRTTASWADTDIAVCTIEKANSLINSAIEECSIGDLGVVVLDELHMLDDEHRGYLLELMVTKILLLQQDIQIIGMSATLSV